MEIKKIKELAKILREEELSLIELNEGDSSIRLEKFRTAPLPDKNCFPATVSAPVIPQPAQEQASSLAPARKLTGEVDFNEIREIKSPMVGVFYRAPGPDKAPYVNIGDRVKKGDVVCILEAMKIMNEITSDLEGEIIDICAQDGQIVEYGQTLFKIF